jgi:hypothetical protein
MKTVHHPKQHHGFSSMFREANNQFSVVQVAFLLWIITVALCWSGISIYDKKLDDLPPTIVHLTIALGATKVTHRIAEGNWEEIIKKVISAIKRYEKKKAEKV